MANILVVDDSPLNRELIAAMLEKEGHNFSLVENGLQALELANEVKFDLILLDIQMPEMDGFEVLEKLKKSETSQNVPVIAVTAHPMKGKSVLPSWKWQDNEEYITIDCDACISKPIDIDEFFKTINNYLN
ncbi:two-component system cell cycle response regulator DivK [Methanohalophilus levihalophilus]|uniref:response regulator n=1 Tax=Methanohalophilus levihalophilus TaxID=1431282 RepID=UPI001AE6F0A1|nr:response regulator [Methanohalophilus levihalophilus]MBP2031067.1 two-component system cell cycle response regulator DivK [Methanohalophilus levihalophilus]